MFAMTRVASPIMNMVFPELTTCTVAVIGLGYVGLPLAVEFGKSQVCLRSSLLLRRRVIGFDINERRIHDLLVGIDITNEISAEELNHSELLEFSNDTSLLSEADVFLITVPTPIDSGKQPDLTPLTKACVTVGKSLKARAKRLRAASISPTTPFVIFESTVYPGVTEEICVPILERESGLQFNSPEANNSFVCGYSPERINPGDTEYKLTNIIKVTSGSTPEVSFWVDDFYGSIISAGTYLAASLKVAEAAKVIENTQRDLNIALVNELAIIFREMHIDTLDVLEAAGSKWNFLPFRPGLVGGHCIGVDPYYLTHKAEQLGYHPQVVLAGRRINDGMGRWVVEQLVLEMAQRGIVISGSRVLVLGFTFKENCPDFRNTRVADVVKTLTRFGMIPVIVDPCLDHEAVLQEHDLIVHSDIPADDCYSAVMITVGHDQFKAFSSEKWQQLIYPFGVIMDLKGFVPRELNPVRL